MCINAQVVPYRTNVPAEHTPGRTTQQEEPRGSKGKRATPHTNTTKDKVGEGQAQHVARPMFSFLLFRSCQVSTHVRGHGLGLFAPAPTSRPAKALPPAGPGMAVGMSLSTLPNRRRQTNRNLLAPVRPPTPSGKGCLTCTFLAPALKILPRERPPNPQGGTMTPLWVVSA